MLDFSCECIVDVSDECLEELCIVNTDFLEQVQDHEPLVGPVEGEVVPVKGNETVTCLDQHHVEVVHAATLVPLESVAVVHLLLAIDDIKWNLDFGRVFEIDIKRC